MTHAGYTTFDPLHSPGEEQRSHAAGMRLCRDPAWCLFPPKALNCLKLELGDCQGLLLRHVLHTCCLRSAPGRNC